MIEILEIIIAIVLFALVVVAFTFINASIVGFICDIILDLFE